MTAENKRLLLWSKDEESPAQLKASYTIAGKQVAYTISPAPLSGPNPESTEGHRWTA